MSVRFAARYSIIYVEDLGGGEWRLAGKVYDNSSFVYLAPDATVGDVVIDENPETGNVNRWRIISIVSASGRDLTCDVVWDDEGTEDEYGPQMCSAAICSTSVYREIAEVPTIVYSGIEESIQTRIHNINNRYTIDPATGTSGTSGTSGVSTSGTSGTSGNSGESGTSGTSGSSGTGGTSGTSGTFSTYQYTSSYSESTSWVVTHNLGSSMVMVQCYSNETPKKMMMPYEISLDSVNQCTISWGNLNIAGSVCVLKF